MDAVKWNHIEYSVRNPEYQEPRTLRCECGAEIAGSPGHASWCPMVELNKEITKDEQV